MFIDGRIVMEDSDQAQYEAIIQIRRDSWCETHGVNPEFWTPAQEDECLEYITADPTLLMISEKYKDDFIKRAVYEEAELMLSLLKAGYSREEMVSILEAREEVQGLG